MLRSQIMLKLLVLVIIAFGVEALKDYSEYIDYCSLDCRNTFGKRKHTVCERSDVKCGPHPRCQKFSVIPLTDSFRQKLLDKHNECRNKVALGKENRGNPGPQPPAANMQALSYSKELEYIAQCWANTCQIQSHDKCRRTSTMSVGQNMALRGQSWPDGLEDPEMTKQLIEGWYDEVLTFNPNEINYFVGGAQGTGHYTEMVWANIEYVGCALSKYYSDGWFYLLAVCNYGGRKTGGNLLGSRIYNIGEPCSECPYNSQCNPKYKGLCGIDAPVSQNINYINTTSVSSTNSIFNFNTTHDNTFIDDLVHIDNGQSLDESSYNNESGIDYGNVQLVLIVTFWTLLSKMISVI